MRFVRLLALLVLSMVTMGADRSCGPVPLFPQIKGSWESDCGSVDLNDPFRLWVKKFIEFKEKPQEWTALDTRGTYAQITQSGTYVYSNGALMIKDASGTNLEEFSVSSISKDQLQIKSSQHTCTLTSKTSPELLTGTHLIPPKTTRVRFEVSIDDTPLLAEGKAQFSNLYSFPQLQTTIALGSDYKLGYQTLHIQVPGDQVGQYAISYQLYRTKNSELLVRTDGKVIALDEAQVFEYQDGNTRFVIKGIVF